ncbi:SDR family oxidoreductase [Allonocardiopsis opalescens]|uniref:Uncharacterized protein YbjT (DUF2867 family) n=1 Tax=Allonocardiopsis opalescens TaxID=1144618 RepID=A0A2T0Q4K8_9ACTN|nr:NAD(P)H-binding protein [Allonocardiopsis opalescens]PRX98703.1 uncharacterized protein YbjT (DUF2867 family) [Allonocardiopsis opalescens]
MERTVLVTGGTGTVGRGVVERLAAGGHRVRVLSRRERSGRGPGTAHRGDLRDGRGLDAALDGADTVVHCATGYSGTADLRQARRLLAAARRAGVRHLVYISIVGVDAIGFGYYRGKLAVEEALAASGLGWTVLRTTQFHQLVVRICALAARPPLALAPDVPVQPVDADEVAARLAALAAGEPAGRVPDMGGPRVERLPDLLRTYLARSGRRRPVVAVPLPPIGAAAGYRAGRHLAPDGAVGRTGFAEFLAAGGGR